MTKIIRLLLLPVLILSFFLIPVGSDTLANSFPILRVSQESIDFGEIPVGSESQNITLTVANDPCAMLILSVWNIRIEGEDAAQFVITHDKLSNTAIDNGNSSTLDIKFTPSHNGLVTANLTIETDTGEDVNLSRLVIPLKGFGVYGESNMPFENNTETLFNSDYPQEVLIENLITCTYSGFLPSVLTVAACTEVTWKNVEHIDQCLASDDNLFNVYIPMDYTFFYVFTTPGVYTYRDDLHPELTGKIIVNS